MARVSRPLMRRRWQIAAGIVLSALLAGSTAIGRAGAPLADTPAQASPASQTTTRPNILWIVSEDNGPQIGAYGDAYATTPNLDQLAARGYRYRVAWSNGPVCGASRTALITGVYPQSTGGEHMRSLVPLPAFMRLYPTLLREAGYYTTNNSKTDYNYAEVGQVWDASSTTAHWKNRKPGQPFFAIFNDTRSHESQVRTRPHTWVHDVEKAPVPAYMPNVTETREDWAQYYDNLSLIDSAAGSRLAELAAAGLADDTIVMYYGDHGAGLPRSKRFPYNSGLQVPLIVYIPPKFRALGPPEASRPGSVSDRLVSFVDFAPTLVSLAGQKPPDWMQGRAFLGPHTAPAPEYLFGFRGRMDERFDLTRSVRDQRYVYLRNYMPHRPHGQHVSYMFETPTTVVWKRMFDAGQLKPPQTAFWEPKPSEELYDLQTDPQETRNLAASSTHRAVLDRLRLALDAHARAIRDVGFLPEYELQRDIATITPYERARDPKRYDFDRIHLMAQRASDRAVPMAMVAPGLADTNPTVRYWAAMGAVIRGRDTVLATLSPLVRLLDDPEPGPRIVAAEAIGRFGPAEMRDRALAVLVRDADVTTRGGFVSHLALYTLNQFTDLPQAVKDAVAKAPTAPPPGESRRGGDYAAIVKAAIAKDVR